MNSSTAVSSNPTLSLLAAPYVHVGKITVLHVSVDGVQGNVKTIGYLSPAH
jgi:hypothetical protein